MFVTVNFAKAVATLPSTLRVALLAFGTSVRLYDLSGEEDSPVSAQCLGVEEVNFLGQSLCL